MRPELVLGLLQAGEKLCGSVGWEATEGKKIYIYIYIYIHTNIYIYLGT